jgi:hypothetical protein
LLHSPVPQRDLAIESRGDDEHDGTLNLRANRPQPGMHRDRGPFWFSKPLSDSRLLNN